MVTPPRNRRVPYVAPPVRPVRRNVRRGPAPRSLVWRASLFIARCAIVGAFVATCVLLDNF